jgi:adenylate cyclase
MALLIEENLRFRRFVWSLVSGIWYYPFMFILEEIGGAARSWKLREGEPLTFGRLPDNLVRLEELKVSRRHAEVRLQGPKRAVVFNVSDDNVVRVNEKRVPPRGGSWQLAADDLIKIGASTFRVRWKASAPIGFSDAPLGMSATMSPARNSGIEALLSSGGGVEQPSLLQDLRRKAEMLACVCEMSADLLRVDSEKKILEYATEVVMRTLTVDCCAALLLQEDGEMETVCLQFRNKAAKEFHRAISRTAVRTAMEQRVILASQDASRDETLSASESVSVQGIGSLACAPLAGHEEVFGALYVDRRLGPEPFSDTDQQMLLVVAAQAAVAMEAARAREREAREAEARAVYARFMPEHLIKELAEDPDKFQLGGVNRRLSVMFCDVRGFSRLAHGMKPEQVVEMLNVLFTELAAEIMGHQGTLNKYLGDGLMALFGAPVDSETHAVNAVSAAVAMQRSLRRVNEKLIERNLSTLSIGIGINTGEATVGVVGARLRSEYTAIGGTVNIAARVESLTTAGQILVTEATAQELQNRFKLEGPREVHVKNIPDPVRVYLVLHDEGEETEEYSAV